MVDFVIFEFTHDMRYLLWEMCSCLVWFVQSLILPVR